MCVLFCAHCRNGDLKLSTPSLFRLSIKTQQNIYPYSPPSYDLFGNKYIFKNSARFLNTKSLVITQSFYCAHRKGTVRTMVYVFQFRTLFFFLLRYVKACRLKQDTQDINVFVLWIQNFFFRKCKRMELILFTTEF